MAVVLRVFPGGAEHQLPASAFIGRSEAAQLRLDDPHISTAHAELSPRADGLSLRAIRGDLRVRGRSVEEVLLAVGMRVQLAPEVELEVVALEGVDRPQEATLRSRLWRPRPEVVTVSVGADTLTLSGPQAEILRCLLQNPREPWPVERIAVASLALYRDGVSPEERGRLRNLFDKHKGELDRRLVQQRERAEGAPQEPIVVTRHKLVSLRWDPTRDQVG